MINIRTFISLILTALLFSSAIEARAEEDAPAKTIFHADMVVLTNPDGAAIDIGVNRRLTLKRETEGEETSYALYGVSFGINPSYTQVAAITEWMPAPFAVLRLQYDYYIFSGTNGFLMSFPSGDSPFGDEELEALDGEEKYGTGHRFMFKPTLRAKAGPLLMMNETSIAWFVIDGDGPYFREGQYDTLIKDGDLVIDNLTMFPVEIYRSGNAAALYAGVFYHITHAKAADLTRQRTGLLAYWIPRDKLWGADRPRVYSMLGYNLQDRNRDDEVFFILATGFDIEK